MKSSDIKTGLVVVNYNDHQTTFKFIQNIKNFKNIDLIVVVDNCSTDDSYKKLKVLEDSSLKIIKSDKNGGYGYGNNIGIKYAIKILGKCNIIITNPDIEFKNKDIKILTDGLNKDEDCAVVAPIILENGKENKGWKLPTIYQDVLLNIVFIHRYLRKPLLFYESKWYNKKHVQVDCVSGCFFIIKSEIMKKINYFDENIFLYYEENILGKKIKLINKKVFVDTEVKIVHHHSISIDNSVSKIEKYKILKESQMYYHKKYNNASMIGKLLLCLTNKLTLFVLYIYYLLKQGR